MTVNRREPSYRKSIAVSYKLIPFYGDLIKVKQTLLLVFSGVFSWLISSWPSLSLIPLLWILTALFLSISGSTLLNMYIDRDIDAVMERTRHRALPSGKLHPASVLASGALLSIAGVVLAGLYINTITMIVIFLGLFFDVVVYSILLKRRTRFSIIFGGISGGLPVLAGRTAVTGNIDLLGLLMSVFVLCWIPMHILTLAMIPENLENYRKAGVPMWPVVRSREETVKVITLSGILSGVIIIGIARAMNLSHVLMAPVYALSAYMIFLAMGNIKNPSFDRIFLLFKVASIFMAFSFFWLFLATVIK
ncbi:MAG TPA: protoheme IX farnesyltransferase [Spirochaetota bacterium]|nr:protoheme IX farnesyltransferase [Spirochaetota bacterium]